MIVEVRLFATLREGRFKKKEIEFPQGSSMSGLLKRLQIAAEEVGILLVNGRAASADCHLNPRDIVSIFPSLGGG